MPITKYRCCLTVCLICMARLVFLTSFLFIILFQIVNRRWSSCLLSQQLVSPRTTRPVDRSVCLSVCLSCRLHRRDTCVRCVNKYTYAIRRPFKYKSYMRLSPPSSQLFARPTNSFSCCVNRRKRDGTGQDETRYLRYNTADIACCCIMRQEKERIPTQTHTHNKVLLLLLLFQAKKRRKKRRKMIRKRRTMANKNFIIIKKASKIHGRLRRLLLLLVFLLFLVE